jgi:hypothetical protein
LNTIFFVGPVYFLLLSILGIRHALREDAAPATA